MPKRDAFEQIAAGMRHQVAPEAYVDLGTAPAEPAYQGGKEALAKSDTGIQGHASDAQRYEDRNDAGELLEVAPVYTGDEWCD